MSKTPATDRLIDMTIALLDVQRTKGTHEAAYAALDYSVDVAGEIHGWGVEDIIEAADAEVCCRPGRTARRVAALKYTISEIIADAKDIRAWRD